MKLIFCDERDIQNPYGKLTFGANDLAYVGEAADVPPMRVRCAVPEKEGN